MNSSQTYNQVQAFFTGFDVIHSVQVAALHGAPQFFGGFPWGGGGGVSTSVGSGFGAWPFRNFHWFPNPWLGVRNIVNAAGAAQAAGAGAAATGAAAAGGAATGAAATGAAATGAAATGAAGSAGLTGSTLVVPGGVGQTLSSGNGCARSCVNGVCKTTCGQTACAAEHVDG